MRKVFTNMTCILTDLDASFDQTARGLYTIMADFDIPNNDTAIDGVYPSEVNFPQPGKRPFSSMSPAILTNDTGDVQLIIGASGGKRITTAVSLV